MSKIMNKEVAIARLRDLGFNYVGADSARELFNAVEAPARRPTPIPEPLGFEWSGRDQQTLVDRFDANPAITYLQATVAGGFVGSAPTFFSSGSLPPFTASGVPPEQLASVAWRLRHSAAMSPSRAYVLEAIERSQDDTVDVDRLQLPEGAWALGDYFKRAWNWASVMPGSEQVSLATSDEAIASMFSAANPLGG